MATGCGALISLSLFLPLPARFQNSGIDPKTALQYSYYIVGGIALLLALVCLFGLKGIKYGKDKPPLTHTISPSTHSSSSLLSSVYSAVTPLYHALLLGFRRKQIFMGYVAGFVARASSVGISLFIPLLVNAAFQSSGLCQSTGTLDNPAGLPDIKRRCPRAYVVAAELTGVSQFVALISAPVFGFVSSRSANKTIPLIVAAVAGIVGYPLFALQFDPHDSNTEARIIAFIAVCLIGISQIGAIVCSLGILATGILEHKTSEDGTIVDASSRANADEEEEEAPLLEDGNINSSSNPHLSDLKGSVAGVYSFYGGAGILLLTKVGGTLFDSTSHAAPFYMMASFNGILLLAGVAVSALEVQ